MNIFDWLFRYLQRQKIRSRIMANNIDNTSDFITHIQISIRPDNTLLTFGDRAAKFGTIKTKYSGEAGTGSYHLKISN